MTVNLPHASKGVVKALAAYHEAGHAVVAESLGIPVVKVEIWITQERDDVGEPFYGGNGRVLTVESDFSTPDDFRNEILVLLAGSEAEARIIHKYHCISLRDARNSVYSSIGSNSDMTEVSKLLSRCPVFSIADGKELVINLVTDLWDVIHDVGCTLERQEKLTQLGIVGKM